MVHNRIHGILDLTNKILCFQDKICLGMFHGSWIARCLEVPGQSRELICQGSYLLRAQVHRALQGDAIRRTKTINRDRKIQHHGGVGGKQKDQLQKKGDGYQTISLLMSSSSV
jgi:hypothetical protein